MRHSHVFGLSISLKGEKFDPPTISLRALLARGKLFTWTLRGLDIVTYIM